MMLRALPVFVSEQKGLGNSQSIPADSSFSFTCCTSPAGASFGTSTGAITAFALALAAISGSTEKISGCRFIAMRRSHSPTFFGM